jgi:mRNA-degrading endonuclease toxin of MazEF toxin-antitoxin module
MASATSAPPKPRQGEIWYVRLPTDPASYTGRPVVVVSSNARNMNDRASTVLVVPLSTTLRDPLAPTNLRLRPGDTGLREQSELQAGNITTIRKSQLRAPRERLRQLSHTIMRKIAARVAIAMDVLVEEIEE